MKFFGIDIGILHLGCCILNFDETDKDAEPIVEWFELIDLTKLKHNVVKMCDCKLSHTSLAVDRVQHFLQEYSYKIDECQYVYIERQPIMGITSVEQLILHFLRKKTVLVSPNSIHKYFQMPRLDYETRKEMSIQIAKKYIKNNKLLEKISCMERAHDVSDSILIALFGSKDIVDNIRKELKLKVINENFVKRFSTGVDDYFNSFAYKPNQN